MLKRIFIVIGLVSLFQAKSQSTQILAESKIANYFNAEATQLIKDAIDNDKCVGISAGFSLVNDHKWFDGKGFSNEAKKSPFTPNTLTRIASISKPITAIAIMQLVEQGKITLDQPLSDILREDIYEDKGYLTIKQLLEHSSGLGGYTSKKERENTKEYETLCEASSIFMERKLLFEPGSRFNYTSYGYTILGIVVEKVSDMSFEDYLRVNIFEKAGMSNTGIEKYGEVYENKSSVYHKNSRGKIKQVNFTNLSDRLPGGGIQSTVEDMLKFGDAVLNGSLIKPETLKLMATNSGLKKEGNGYGLGFYLYGKNPKYGDVIGHTGGQIGCSGIFFLLPEVKTSIIVLSNTSGAMQEVTNIGVKLFDISNQSN